MVTVSRPSKQDLILNSKLLLTVFLIAVVAVGIFWYLSRPETPGYQGGLPSIVKSEILASSKVMMNRQDALNTLITVKQGASVEVAIDTRMTNQYSAWSPVNYDFDFRPKIEGNVDWDTMRNVDLGYTTPESKSRWSVHLGPGDYEFRLHVMTENRSDVTQPPQLWMIGQGQLQVQSK